MKKKKNKKNPPLICKRCNKEVTHHKSCKWCGLLLHGEEVCVHNVEEIKAKVKTICTDCDNLIINHEGESSLKRYLRVGNYCAECNSRYANTKDQVPDGEDDYSGVLAKTILRTQDKKMFQQVKEWLHKKDRENVRIELKRIERSKIIN